MRLDASSDRGRGQCRPRTGHEGSRRRCPDIQCRDRAGHRCQGVHEARRQPGFLPVQGLAAPVGSVMLGTREYIESCRRYRKMVGGGMRQAGIIAAPGIVALTKMVSRLKEDHVNARALAMALIGFEGIDIDMETVQTNLVIAEHLRHRPELGRVRGEMQEERHPDILVRPSKRPVRDPLRHRIQRHQRDHLAAGVDAQIVPLPMPDDRSCHSAVRRSD